MPREAGTFSCPEHAIAAAYLMLAMPIEPKNPTQLVCEALRERFDVEYERKALSGLTPHEWHAQAVFIVKLMERTLGDSVGFHILRAQYGTGEEGAASARRVSEWLNAEAAANSNERILVDLLVTNILRGRPRIRDLSDRFDVPKSNIGRLASAYRVLIEGARRAASSRDRNAGAGNRCEYANPRGVTLCYCLHVKPLTLHSGIRREPPILSTKRVASLCTK